MKRKIKAVGRGYSGLEKVKLYHYDKNGKYLKTFESNAQLFKEYFESKKRPLFNSKRWIKFNYDILEDGTFYSNYRIGREKIFKCERIVNSKYCFNNCSNNKRIVMFNLENDPICEFKNSYIASLVTNINLADVYRSAQSGKGKPKNEIYFKYKN